MAAQRRLARIYDWSGMPGGALRHFEIALRGGGLGGNDRNRLVGCISSGRARVCSWVNRMRTATSSGRRSSACGRPAGSAPTRCCSLLWPRCAGATTRTSTTRARSCAAPASSVPDDDCLALLDPEHADVRQLGAAAAWAHDGGARRLALDLYTIYVERDGRQAEHLRRWLDDYLWWNGLVRRPDLRLLREAQQAGLNLCPFARVPSELGCVAAIAPLVEAPAEGEIVPLACRGARVAAGRLLGCGRMDGTRAPRVARGRRTVLAGRAFAPR